MVYKPFSPNSVATLAVLTVAIKAGCSFEVVSCVRSIIWWNLQHKRALLCERCPFAFRLHRLAQTKRRGELSRNPLVTLRASDRSHCGGVRIFRSLAQHSSLCACQTALIVAWCEFGDPSRNPLGTLSLSDRSRCGPVLVLRSLAQPSRHFGRVRSLSLWRSADFDHQGGGLL